MRLAPSGRSFTRPTSVLARRPGRNAGVTSLALTELDTLPGATLAGRLICTSTSPPVTRSARVESGRTSNPACVWAAAGRDATPTRPAVRLAIAATRAAFVSLAVKPFELVL